MRKKELEIALSKLEGFGTAVPSLEQVRTPGDIAADMLTTAVNDIEGKRVYDLGCGTGVLAVGAALLGAKVVAVDVDGAAIAIAQKNAQGLPINFVLSSVENFVGERFDTVVMNPPFGAQRKHADRPFLQKARELAPVIYTLHLATTRNFIKGFLKGVKSEVVKTYDFPLPRTFAFHEKRKVVVPVDLWRIEDGSSND